MLLHYLQNKVCHPLLTLSGLIKIPILLSPVSQHEISSLARLMYSVNKSLCKHPSLLMICLYSTGLLKCSVPSSFLLKWKYHKELLQPNLQIQTGTRRSSQSKYPGESIVNSFGCSIDLMECPWKLHEFFNHP